MAVELSPSVLGFLNEKHFGKLATTMRDGSPQLTPIWYMVEGGKIIVNTTTERTKYRNITRDTRICFLVDDGYPYVIIFGRARVAAERDPNRDIEALAVRYTGQEEGSKAARERFWKQPRVSVEIVPERIVAEL